VAELKEGTKITFVDILELGVLKNSQNSDILHLLVLGPHPQLSVIY